MREARRKTNLLVRFHPVLWGFWIVLVFAASLFGFETMLAVPFVTFFGLIIYVNSTRNEIECVLPLRDDEIRKIWNGGVTRICGFGAIAGFLGIGVHLVYLMSEFYEKNLAFVKVMRKLEGWNNAVSELTFGIGGEMYGYRDICPSDLLEVSHLLRRIWCSIAVSALCLTVGMLLLYLFGLWIVGSERKKSEAESREHRVRDVIVKTGIVLIIVLYAVMVFGVLFQQAALLCAEPGYNLVFLIPAVIVLVVFVYLEKHRRFEVEYSPERTA